MHAVDVQEVVGVDESEVNGSGADDQLMSRRTLYASGIRVAVEMMLST